MSRVSDALELDLQADVYRAPIPEGAMSESVCVFVVEDDAVILVTIEHALQDGGFDFETAMTGAEALQLFQEHGERCRALVTDVNLGGELTGWDVAREARALNPTIPVVYVTAEQASDWAIHGVPNSVLVSKPFVEAQITNAIASLLNDQSTTMQPTG
jgi:CheY-like chemotaxis protein